MGVWRMPAGAPGGLLLSLRQSAWAVLPRTLCANSAGMHRLCLRMTNMNSTPLLARKNDSVLTKVFVFHTEMFWPRSSQPHSLPILCPPAHLSPAGAAQQAAQAAAEQAAPGGEEGPRLTMRPLRLEEIAAPGAAREAAGPAGGVEAAGRAAAEAEGPAREAEAAAALALAGPGEEVARPAGQAEAAGAAAGEAAGPAGEAKGVVDEEEQEGPPQPTLKVDLRGVSVKVKQRCNSRLCYCPQLLPTVAAPNTPLTPPPGCLPSSSDP